jgi:gliding motility-associated-like protein
VKPSPIANFGLSSEVSCILNPVQFNDSSLSSTPLTYQWDFDNGFTSTLQNPTTTYNSVGVYDVSLIVTSQNGCKDTVELPAPLNVLPPPVASFSHNTNCFNNTIDFIQNSTGGSIYSWNFGDPGSSLDVSSLEEPSWTYPDSGSYTVTLIVNPGTSCMGTISNIISLNLPLIPTLSAPPGECIYSNSFNLSPAGSYMGNGTFSWNFGSHATPSSSSNENPSNIVFDTTGTFPVSLSITENGCTANLNTTINVYPKPEAFFEITTVTGCALNPVHFIDDSQSDTPLTYLWNFGNGSSSTVQDPFVTYADSGHYTISLEITTTHGCKDTFEFGTPLIVFPSPVAGFHIDPTYTSIFAPDVTMTDLSIGASACEANWGDGFITSVCSMIHTYTTAGTYQLMQQVLNTYGCYDTANAQVIIDDNYLFWLPNAFTPGNLDGTNDDFKPKAIGIYDYSFMIFNRWGEKLFETTDLEEGWNGIYKGNLCSNDVYVYKINFRDKKLNNQHEYIGRVTLVR